MFKAQCDGDMLFVARVIMASNNINGGYQNFNWMGFFVNHKHSFLLHQQTLYNMQRFLYTPEINHKKCKSLGLIMPYIVP